MVQAFVPGDRQEPVGVPMVLMERARRVAPLLGYESVPEYVRAALREKLREDEEQLSLLAEADDAARRTDRSKGR